MCILPFFYNIFRHDSSKIEVILGRHNYTGSNYEASEQKRRVIRNLLHPNFNESYLDNDFALLQLETEVEITEHVKLVCLPEDPFEDFGGGRTAIATGIVFETYWPCFSGPL